jgi:hypothetical protein
LSLLEEHSVAIGLRAIDPTIFFLPLSEAIDEELV